MMRLQLKLAIILFCLLNIAAAQNQTLIMQNEKSVYLTGVNYSFQFGIERDSLAENIMLTKDDKIIKLQLMPSPDEKGKFISQKVQFSESGTWKLNSGSGTEEKSMWVVPGWFSLLPPFIAILLALITRQVLIALFAGIFFGSFIIYDYSIIEGFFYSLTEFIAKAPADPNNMAIIVFTLTLGGMVGVISRSGGTQGIVEWLSKFASDSRRGQLATWAMGIFIFFDDYANTLIVGNTMRPLTDKLKISREKLAYLVDSTAAPITTVAIVSTWIGYQLSLIDQAFKSINLDKNAYVTFLQTIPYAFYPLFALLFAFLIAVMGRDFLFMLTAERRAKNEGKLLRDNAVPLVDVENDILAKEGTPLRAYNALIPVLSVIAVTLAGLWITGVQATGNLDTGIGFVQYVSTVFGNADSFKVLIWAAFVGSILAIILALGQRILNLNDSLMAWVSGVKSMMMAALILTLAWSIGNICKEMQTADYVIFITADLLSPNWIPTLAFTIAGVIAFSTGTSWATMAILTPIVIPLAYQLPLADPTISESTQVTIFLSSIAAILAGSVFGDHCSPISDTTIMSSMASGSDHIDHVRTQMPYALVVAFISIIFGFIPAGFGMGGIFEMILGAVVLFLIVRFWGKKI